MSRAFSPGMLRGEQRRNLVEAVEKHMQAAAIRAVGEVLMGCLDREVTVKLAREKGAPRQISGQPREIHWQCKNCGCTHANDFTRDGHYRRELKTGWGKIQKVQVPMLQCQKCQHDVICDARESARNMTDFGSIWIKMSCGVVGRVRVCVRWPSDGVRPRETRSDCARERINQIELLAQKYHEQPIDDVPDVIQFDGMRDDYSRGKSNGSVR